MFKQPEPKAFLYAVAKEYQANVSRHQPVNTGETQSIFDSTSKIYKKTSHGRPQMQVTTGDSLWHIIEYGSVNNPPYAPFRKAAEGGLGIEWKSA